MCSIEYMTGGVWLSTGIGCVPQQCNYVDLYCTYAAQWLEGDLYCIGEVYGAKEFIVDLLTDLTYPWWSCDGVNFYLLH